MTNFITAAKTVLITLPLSLVLTACSLDLSSLDTDSSSPTAIVVTGSVGDGPVVGSIITVKDANNAIIASNKSDSQANFETSFPSDTPYPVLISATGGLDTVTLAAPDFVMLSATLDNSETNANINPFSTLIVKTAQAMPGGLTSQNLIAARLFILNRMNFGLDPRLLPDPIKTPVTESNVANIIKASEALAESIRRTSKALLAAGIDLNEDQVIDFLAGDLIDGAIDGLGTGADTRVAATFNVVSGQVLIETVRNQLFVNGTLATTALDNAILLTTPTATENTADVLIVAAMLTQTQTAISATQALPLTTTTQTALSDLATILDGIAADDLAATIDALLPSTASDTFDQAITAFASATEGELLAVNATLTGTSNNAPNVSNVVISDDNGGAAVIGDTLSGSYSYTDTEGDAEASSTFRWLRNGTAISGATSLNYTLIGTDAPSQINLEVTPMAATGTTIGRPVTSSEITVVNSAPTISGTPTGTVMVDTLYSFTPIVSDADGNSLTFSISNKPIWASFNTSTGALTGTPGTSHVGTSSGIIISVNDGSAATALPAFDITVTEPAVNNAPTASNVSITDSNSGNAVVSDTLIGSYSYADAEGDTEGSSSYRWLRNGTAISGANASSYTLVTADSGTTITFEVTPVAATGTSTGNSVSSSAMTVVNSAPVISGVPAGSVVEGSAYSFTPAASDVDGNTLAFAISNKPLWASFNTSTGALTGTPDTSHVGTSSGIIISVNDGILVSSLPAFDITVSSKASTTVVMVSSNADLSNPVALSGALLDGSVYIFFQEGADWATRGVNNVTFYCCKSSTEAHTVYPADSTSPYMINVDLSQFATGTTREFYADAFFNDGSKDSFLVNFTISSLNPDNTAPVISGTPASSVAEDSTYSFIPTASDVDGDTLYFSISNKPAWASFNTSTGALTGTPTNSDVGTSSNIIISVDDRTDITSLAAFSITVTNVNDAPTITGTPATVVVENTAYSFTPTASDVDGDVLTFSIANQPVWSSFNTSTGALTGTPSTSNIGTASGIIISVSDGTTTAALAAFDLTVSQVIIGSATLSWTPPLENTDGSALIDLAGYKIYYGTSVGSYTTTIDINTTGITDYVLTDLAGPTTYYFVMTAYNSAGDESVYSNSASKTIQ